MVALKILIEQGDVEKVAEKIFNQTFSLSTENSGYYTEPLDEDYELMVVRAFLADNAKWKEFLSRYLDHYPLFTDPTCLLIQNISNSEVASLVQKIFAEYGYNDKEIRLFAQQKCSPEIRANILQTICDNVRVFDRDIFAILEKFDTHSEKENPTQYAEIYRKNSKIRHSQRYH